MAVSFHDLREVAAPASLFDRTEADLSEFLARAAPIIEAVRNEGDAALFRFGRTLDRADGLTSLRVTEEEFSAAAGQVTPALHEAIAVSIARVRAFHEAQMPQDMWLRQVSPGVWAGERTVPIDSVACYVPRGKGAFPSVLTMTVVPGRVAGVPRLVVVTPPGPDGRVDAATLVACRLAGVGEVFKAGGAQAVAAVAYGTQTVPRCLKIVGPGSPYVVAAKRLLAGVIDPGLPAGPSEAIVLADGSADGALAALDLIVESEHGPDSGAFLVTDDAAVADAARAALPGLWAAMDPARAAFSRAVLEGPRGGIVLVRDQAAALDFVNTYAPEHLMIVVRDPMAVLPQIRNAGEVLIGPHTPMPLANYLLGPNAVLPTGGWARTTSALSVFDYMKRISVAWSTPEAYPVLAAQVRVLATYEGFDGHARAVSDTRGT